MKNTRLRLLLDYPFFGNIAVGMDLIEDATVETVETNGHWIKYNPDFTKNLTSNEKLFIYQHEICHIILGHPFRRQDRDHNIYQMAGDYAINLMLVDMMGVPIPGGGLYDIAYKGLSSEHIYEILFSKYKDQAKQHNKNQPGPDPGPNPESGSNQDQGQDQDSPGQDQDQDESGEDQVQDGSGQDQEEDDQGQDPKQVPDPKPKSKPEPEPKPDPKQEEFEEMVKAVKKSGISVDAPDATKEHETQSIINMSDFITGGVGISSDSIMRKVLTEMTSNNISWKELLTRFMNRSREDDYSWSVPNHRYQFGDVIMPSIKTKNSLKLAVAIDTSGSVNDYLLEKFMAEFKTLVSSIEYEELLLISCDDETHNPQRFHKFEEIDYTPVGGGCTDFRPVWEYIVKEAFLPDCLIYFTDLGVERDGFGEDPMYPVMWIGQFYNENQEIPFGERVPMREE